MKKVLFLITTLGGGGAEKVLTTISKNLDKSNYEITVMTITDSGIYRDEVKKYVRYESCFKELKPGHTIFEKIYNILYQNIIIKFILKHPKLFYKIFIKDNYDVEIAFLENVCAKIIGNSPNKKSKKYLWIHIDLEKSNWCKTHFNGIEDQRITYSKFNKIFCVSNEVKKTFNNLFGLENKTFVQYNSNDDKEIIKLSHEEIDEFYVTEKFKFISSGRFIQQKGFDRLLEVHRNLLEEGYDYELWILGDGIEKSQYEQYVNYYNLQNNTRFLGFKKNPYKFMKNSNAFVCSSRMEGFSLVVSEAIILNIPVISTSCTGPNELLDYGRYGLLVENSTEGIYRGMKKFLDDDIVYKHYKDMSIRRGKDFQLDKVMKEIDSILSY